MKGADTPARPSPGCPRRATSVQSKGTCAPQPDTSTVTTTQRRWDRRWLVIILSETKQRAQGPAHL